MTRLLLVPALLVVFAGNTFASPVPPPQQSAVRPAHDLTRLREWIDAADRHNPGQADVAAATVGAWSQAELERLFLDLKALLQVITAPDRPRFPREARAFTLPELKDLEELALREAQRVDGHKIRLPREITAADARRAVNRLVKRATLLHTDIALLVRAAADTSTDSRGSGRRPLLAPRSSLQIVDGRQVGVAHYGAHWDFARLLLDEVTPQPASDAVVRRWYRAIADLFESEHVLAESRVHLARARELFPADAELAAASGRLYENYASSRVQNFLETGANGRGVPIGSSRSNLRQAETFFRKAVELDASFAGGRLHLGRVLGLEGHHEDAAAELQRAAVTAGDSVTQYYAWLFLGVEEQSLGHPDRARDSYVKAAALYPRAQSPFLALSQLARRRGDRSGALGAIQQALALSANDRVRDDPWSAYPDGSSAEEAHARLSEIRAVLFLTPEER